MLKVLGVEALRLSYTLNSQYRITQHLSLGEGRETLLEVVGDATLNNALLAISAAALMK